MRSIGPSYWLALLLSPTTGLAQTTDAAAAEALFQEGRALLTQGNHDAACPKLEESHRLDPATGTLIALAACHERQGRFASAWAEFTEASGRAARELRRDRQELASSSAKALEGRLSVLTIRVGPQQAQLRGLVITRSGLSIGPGAWNVPVPIDGGEYELEVKAPAMKTWRTRIHVRPERDRVSVIVPRLEPAAAPPVPGPPLRRPDPERWSRTRWLGVGYAATGVVGLGASGFMLLRALDKKQDADASCSGTICQTPEGQADSDDAVAFGTWATVFGIGGGALLATGATLFWIGRSEPSEDATRVSVMPSPSGPRVSVGGRF